MFPVSGCVQRSVTLGWFQAASSTGSAIRLLVAALENTSPCLPGHGRVVLLHDHTIGGRGGVFGAKAASPTAKKSLWPRSGQLKAKSRPGWFLPGTRNTEPSRRPEGFLSDPSLLMGVANAISWVWAMICPHALEIPIIGRSIFVNVQPCHARTSACVQLGLQR